MTKKRLVISTGAGISAESGIRTFRDADGLWEEYPVMDVCSADGYRRDPALVHRFYNERRHQLLAAVPNAAHTGLVALEEMFDVYIITQNVDDLHERAGSSRVMHLHGELMRARAVDDDSLTFPLAPDACDTTPDTVIDGHRVRPHIVFFQEAVPMFEPATELVAEADIFVIIGTSLAVYPAAALLHYVRRGVPVYYIDRAPAAVPAGVRVIRARATEGVAILARELRDMA
ncbi:MAG: NAD-dependent deacylase [Bacteroides sp.]|nr:NAD-dependent deacylase [Bacteroides sp.]MCM1095604.1 NAD-dependent deacylase [Terasakiella sp.]